MRISIRLPPNVDPAKARKVLTEKLTKNVPHNCKVKLVGGMEGWGWCMKEPSPCLENALKTAGAEFFNG